MATITSSASVTATATVTITQAWLKDPTDPTLNRAIDRSGPWEGSLGESLGALYPLGRPKPIVSFDAMHGEDGTLVVECWTQQEWLDLKALRTTQRPLLLQSPFGEQWYIRFVGPMVPVLVFGTSTADTYRTVSCPYLEVDAP